MFSELQQEVQLATQVEGESLEQLNALRAELEAANRSKEKAWAYIERAEQNSVYRVHALFPTLVLVLALFPVIIAIVKAFLTRS